MPVVQTGGKMLLRPYFVPLYYELELPGIVTR